MTLRDPAHGNRVAKQESMRNDGHNESQRNVRKRCGTARLGDRRFGHRVPGHQVLFERFDRQCAALAFGFFELETRLAQLFAVFGILGEQTVVGDRPPPFQVRPVSADGFDRRDHRPAVHAGAKAGLLGQ